MELRMRVLFNSVDTLHIDNEQSNVDFFLMKARENNV